MLQKNNCIGRECGNSQALCQWTYFESAIAVLLWNTTSTISTCGCIHLLAKWCDYFCVWVWNVYWPTNICVHVWHCQTQVSKLAHLASGPAGKTKKTWCERCLLITESPNTPGHYRYLIWVLGYIPYTGLAVFSFAISRVPVYTAISNF